LAGLQHPRGRSSFRAALTKAGFHSEWRVRFGPEAWRLLEKVSGKLA